MSRAFPSRGHSLSFQLPLSGHVHFKPFSCLICGLLLFELMPDPYEFSFFNGFLLVLLEFCDCRDLALVLQLRCALLRIASFLKLLELLLLVVLALQFPFTRPFDLYFT